MSFRTRALGSLVLSIAAWAPASHAQSNDGFHAIQVFPVVADTASFTQRFHFRNIVGGQDVTVQPTYYPAQGTTPALPVTCPSFAVSPNGERSFASLRAICPGLPAGSVFGTLVARSTTVFGFSGFSRVSNPAGNGFSVEAFPASSFTAADTSVTGLRRMASTANSPAFQTNCFVGNLVQFTPVLVTPTSVLVTLYNSSGQSIGSGQVNLVAGQVVRLLDVFSWAHAAAGDFDDVVAQFSTVQPAQAGIVAFCTVQDNTSFGADFRIAKQEFDPFVQVPGPHDGLASRWTFSTQEEAIDSETQGAQLAIPAGATRNIHSFYFRHPDLLSCSLFDPALNPLAPAYGLEMRLRVHDPDGWKTLVGGNDVTYFAGLYLGDKGQHGNGGNTRYQLEVESNGQNTGASRPYQVLCVSGSGHTQGELLRKGLPTTF